MTCRPVVIRGFIALDPPRALAGAVAEVQLRARAMADAPAPLVARAEVAIPSGAIGRLPFRIEAQVDETAVYALGAEIRRSGGATLAPGDLVTVSHHPWRYGGGSVVLAVKETG